MKATGTRAKKASSNRDMTGRSKLYLEAEAVIRLNGTAKEDSVTNTNKKGSLDVSLMNGDIQISSSKPVAKPMSSFGGESKARDSLISDKITMPGCAESNKDKVGVNGCPDVYSHLLKPNVESSFGSGVVSAKMLSVMCVNMKEDSKSTDGGGTQNPVRGEVMANHVVDGAVTERGNTAVGTNNDSEFGSTPVSSVSIL